MFEFCLPTGAKVVSDWFQIRLQDHAANIGGG
jgi:hypothetical protein